jgi:hypothetical protein
MCFRTQYFLCVPKKRNKVYVISFVTVTAVMPMDRQMMMYVTTDKCDWSVYLILRSFFWDPLAVVVRRSLRNVSSPIPFFLLHTRQASLTVFTH